MRITDFERITDKSYYTFDRMDEYHGHGYSFYAHFDSGNTFEYFLGNYKGWLNIIRTNVDADEEVWENVDYITEGGLGDYAILNVHHLGNGRVTIRLQDPWEGEQVSLRINISE